MTVFVPTGISTLLKTLPRSVEVPLRAPLPSTRSASMKPRPPPSEGSRPLSSCTPYSLVL